jgi:hypothetical protein
MAEITYSTQRLDHLGIVSGVCQQIGLIEQIDTYVGTTGRKVSVGEAVRAMVLNALGFLGRALYPTLEFFSNKPVDLLIRAGLTAECRIANCDEDIYFALQFMDNIIAHMYLMILNCSKYLGVST